MSVPGRFRVCAVDPPTYVDLVHSSPDNNTRRGADRPYATDIAGLDQAPQPYRPHLSQRLPLGLLDHLRVRQTFISKHGLLVS